MYLSIILKGKFLSLRGSIVVNISLYGLKLERCVFRGTMGPYGDLGKDVQKRPLEREACGVLN